jgi:hypothetical protein
VDFVSLSQRDEEGQLQVPPPLLVGRNDSASRLCPSVPDHGCGGLLAREICVDRCGGFAAFCDSPDYERLATAHVTRGEDAIDGCHVVGIGGNIAALIHRDA